ncbi:hypothetical protein N7520_009319 [Penicillium odoratum]|uniref:uncharacterized protein n=1 Tax=Penicillium odoratum TaxID=1167516 RepID=UPI002548B437|nr:uncharacterized protein N7520_009319 [Penicillium odoratum]KAJ5752402.1 hypothetical protein N7520_009319 [Penicillium odoratum]
MEVSCADDTSFGPTVQGCRGNFDFTLKFEKIILSILPSAVFIVLSVPRVIFLTRKPYAKTVDGKIFQLIKLTAAAIYTSLQLSLLIIGSIKPFIPTELSTSASVLSLFAAILVAALSFLEHSRSPRPSILLSVFLSLTVLCDAAQVRSLWLLAHSYHELKYVKIFTATVAWKAILVLLESVHRRSWLGWDWRIHSPEEATGIYGLGTFVWITPLFMLGYRKVLNLSDLFPLDKSVSVKSLEPSFTHIKLTGFHGDKNGLTKAVARNLALPFLLPVAPRIALVGFTICQPFLIQAILSFLVEPNNSLTTNKGYGLIGATALVYAGISFSTALYWYLQERALFKTRACLASAIYRQTVQARGSNGDDAAAVTLMSTDVERVRMGLMQLHEFWASPIQVAVACWLLQQRLGAAFVAPMVVVFICIISSSILVRFVGPRQTAWMKSIQKRVGHTANVISNMKHLKISGLTKPVEDAIQMLRGEEIDAGGKFRAFLVGSVGIAYVPVLLGPVFAFALTSRELNISKVYTSISWLQLLSGPLTSLFQVVPQLIAAFSCLSRIQLFLEQEPRQDFRQLIAYGSSEKDDSAGNWPSIEVRNADFGYEKDIVTLKNINLSISRGLTMIIGPVACGKSTLCTALLGEIPIASGETFIRTKFAKIGYCHQVPFLPNERIKEVIIGYSDVDEERYGAVVQATMLSQDLILLPQGDQTKIGSNGIALSGGQKQRVALARALYLQCDLLILDDPLGGLDTNTEERVFHNLFGPTGILRQRGAASILCTNTTRHLPLADHIVALGSDGTIVEKGRFCDLVANPQYIHTLGLQANADPCDPITKISQSETGIQGESPKANPSENEEFADESGGTEPSRAMGDAAVFTYYCRNIGAFWLAIFVIFGVLTGFLFNFPTIWLGFWSADSFNQSKSFYIGIYALLQSLGLFTLLSVAAIAFLIFIRNSGSRLHDAALRTVISAPLRLFSRMDTGVITNLFSQDLSLIDGELPQSLTNTTLQIWIAAGGAAVIATSSPYIIITYPFVVLILFGVQRFYLRTSRQLRLLDLEAKSPLYTHFLDTINGTITLRAFGWTEDSVIFNCGLLDTSQRPAYQLSMIQRCLSFVLNMIVAVIALLVVILTTQLRSSTSLTGASLVSIMGFGKNLAVLVESYTLLETSIGAVSRIKSFQDDTVPEDLPGEDTQPPNRWPERGMIMVKNISASYSGTDLAEIRGGLDNLALRDLTFTIQAGQKVAICGRTGSGKSSVILLLLRLLDPLTPCTGQLIIDDISLLKIDRSTLRQCIIAVPQDPTFFPDRTTFKKNLDPFNSATIDECHAALQTVGLWPLVSDRGGLEVGLTADTLSHGQKQLFNLARAVLRRRVRARQLNAEVGDAYVSSKSAALWTRGDSGVLILDEINSSVDTETQKVMLEIISREFVGYTVLMVSHRLDMIMGFDKVLVMDHGKLVEEGSPMELIEKDGWFRNLWMAGKTEH